MKLARTIAAAAAALLLSACDDRSRMLGPVEPPADAICELDGMSIAGHPGPKAQIVYQDGRIDYLCSLAELFELLFGEDGPRGVQATYVQDMGKADWQEPRGHWIDSGSAFYVVGSRARGAMGPAVASFATEQDAKGFASREGGRVLRFKDMAGALPALSTSTTVTRK